LEWKPHGKDLEEDPGKALGVGNRKEVVQDRDKWPSIVMAAKYT